MQYGYDPTDLSQSYALSDASSGIHPPSPALRLMAGPLLWARLGAILSARLGAVDGSGRGLFEGRAASPVE